MADLFSGILPFVAVAEEGSFRGAAERLGLTSAAVSKAVARLEEDLDTRLFHRTTRRVRLSQEGELFLARAREAVAQVRAGRDQVAMATGAVQGPLSVSMSPILGRFVTERLADFLGRYPRVHLRLSLSDRLTRLVEDQVDVAVRIGPLSDSSLIARRLLAGRWVTVAAPAYLARRGRPSRPDDLAEHSCVKYLSPRGSPVEWTFAVDGKDVRHATPAALEIDQGDLVVQAAKDGLGIAQALDFMVEDALRTGQLVEVLDEHSAAGPPVHALCLPGQQRSPRVRAVFDFLADAFGQVSRGPGRG